MNGPAFLLASYWWLENPWEIRFVNSSDCRQLWCPPICWMLRWALNDVSLTFDQPEIYSIDIKVRKELYQHRQDSTNITILSFYTTRICFMRLICILNLLEGIGTRPVLLRSPMRVPTFGPSVDGWCWCTPVNLHFANVSEYKSVFLD